MDYQHPNPNFPPIPRKGALPWGVIALILFVVALSGLATAAVGNKDGSLLAGGIAVALFGMIAAGICFTRHARTGGWRSGKIVPAVVAQGAPRSGGAAVAAGLLGVATKHGGLVVAAQNLVTLISYWGGKQQTVQIPAGRLWDQLTEGSVVWIIQPQIVITAQFLEIAAPEEHKLVPVPEDVIAWLTQELGGPVSGETRENRPGKTKALPQTAKAGLRKPNSVNRPSS